MTNYKYLFFDVDGTIIESGDGVLQSYQYAFDMMGISKKVEKEKIVGPPIAVSMQKEYGLSESDSLMGLDYYHKHYKSVGMHSGTYIYDGIQDVLKRCKECGYITATATSKPESQVKFLFEKFDIAKYIDFFGCASDDEKRSKKTEIIEYSINALNIKDRSEILLIGDTIFDMIGARDTNIDALAVGYGYGTYEQMKDYAPKYFARTMDDLVNYLC